MEMTRMTGKCAAVLCGMAMLFSAASAVAPEILTLLSGKAVTACAATGDKYCKVGETYTVEVQMTAQTLENYDESDFSFQWYYSDDKTCGSGKKLSWTKIGGATGKSVSDVMTADKNGRHYMAEVTNNITGAVHDLDWFDMKTVTCDAVSTRFGSASVVEKSGSTYVSLPVYISGLPGDRVSGLTTSLFVDANVFDAPKLFYNTDEFGRIDNFLDDTGEYRSVAFGSAPVAVDPGKPLGTYLLKVKDGASYQGAEIKLLLERANLSGGDVVGVYDFGVTTPELTAKLSVNRAENYVHTDVRTKWKAVSTADGSGVIALCKSHAPGGHRTVTTWLGGMRI